MGGKGDLDRGHCTRPGVEAGNCGHLRRTERCSSSLLNLRSGLEWRPASRRERQVGSGYWGQTKAFGSDIWAAGLWRGCEQLWGEGDSIREDVRVNSITGASQAASSILAWTGRGQGNGAGAVGSRIVKDLHWQGWMMDSKSGEGEEGVKQELQALACVVGWMAMPPAAHSAGTLSSPHTHTHTHTPPRNADQRTSVF